MDKYNCVYELDGVRTENQVEIPSDTDVELIRHAIGLALIALHEGDADYLFSLTYTKVV